MKIAALHTRGIWICMLYAFCTVGGRVASGEGPSFTDDDPNSESILAQFDIQGQVLDRTPNLTESVLSELEDSAIIANGTNRTELLLMMRQFDEAYARILEPQPTSEAVVTLQGNGVEAETLTDQQGLFRFVGIPDGEYALSVQSITTYSIGGITRKAVGKYRIILESGARPVITLQMNAYAFVVKGKVLDSEGQPIEGARVSGILMPYNKQTIQNSLSVQTQADGSYELGPFQPPGIKRVCMYLSGDDPLEGGAISDAFFLDLEAKADGYRMGQQIRIPSVTIDYLVPARRLLRSLIKASPHRSDEDKRLFKERALLPRSTGSSILDIDIQLNRGVSTSSLD